MLRKTLLTVLALLLWPQAASAAERGVWTVAAQILGSPAAVVDTATLTLDYLRDEFPNRTFDLGYVTVEAVEAGYNPNHNVEFCVGYVLTFSDGVKLYVTGDTSKTQQMPALAEKEIDYAFFCCDGIYNMGLEEAAECARLVGAKHNIPYHLVPPNDGIFDRERAEEFDAPDKLIVEAGEEIVLTK